MKQVKDKTHWRMALSVAHRGPSTRPAKVKVVKAAKMPPFNSKVRWR